MQDVAIGVKEKARKSDKKFFDQLQQKFLAVQKKQLTIKTDAK